MEQRLKAIEKNYSLAVKTKEEVNTFFDTLDDDISKMDTFFELDKNIYTEVFHSQTTFDELCLMDILK